MRVRRLVSVATLALAIFAFAAAPGLAAGGKERIEIRVVGPNSNIFEGYVRTGPRDITTESGGTHDCNGLNEGANPTPGPTPTDAVVAAGEKAGFTYNGTWDSEFDDYFPTRIGEYSETDTEFWGVLVNYQFIPIGGCQQEVHAGDEVEFVYNAFNDVHFLKLTLVTGNTVRVIDASTGEPVSGATVGPVANEPGPTTNGNGEATLVFPSNGAHKVTATASNSAPSNALKLH